MDISFNPMVIGGGFARIQNTFTTRYIVTHLFQTLVVINNATKDALHALSGETPEHAST